jgi:serine/threonine protein kinase
LSLNLLSVIETIEKRRRAREKRVKASASEPTSTHYLVSYIHAQICDFGLARLEVEDTETAVFWTDYVATRWYRAPELCGSFYARYTSAVDVWSCGCIFAELLLGK